MAKKKKLPEPQKFRAGQPTKYRPEFCEQIVELGSAGMLPAEVAAHFAVTKVTLHNWRNTHPEFFNAFALYKEICEGWWLKLNREQAEGTKNSYGSQNTRFILAAAFRYYDKPVELPPNAPQQNGIDAGEETKKEEHNQAQIVFEGMAPLPPTGSEPGVIEVEVE